MIKEEFLRSLSQYSSDTDQHHVLWREIEKYYTQSSRHYHTLSHLEAMLSYLRIFENKFRHWNTVVLAVVYHDSIYNTLKQNNEKRSAGLAGLRLKGIGFPEPEIARCQHFILATQHHEASDSETNLFIDADLAILGADRDTYLHYSHQIRLEYSIYPDVLYIPGRKKVLMHFLNMNKIYKTTEFSVQFESRARTNLQLELTTL